MDGNGRWANQRGLPRTAGHEAGELALFDLVAGAIEVGVPYLSVYAFSTENWKRSPEEVRFLMGYNREVLRRRRDQLHEWGVRVRWAGRRPRLWSSVVSELAVAEEQTRDNTVMTLTLCVNYGGRAEIADAAREIARLAAAGRLDPERVDERTIARFLDEPDMPDVDLFLRSSASSGSRTSCSGSRPTPSSRSSTPSGRTSTAATCGTPLLAYAGRERRYGEPSSAPSVCSRAASRTGHRGRVRSRRPARDDPV